jgi:hypothetical protein
MKRCNWLVAYLFFGVLCSASIKAETFLEFNSESGDYIGGGIKQSWSEVDGVFSVTSSASMPNVASFSFNGANWWNLSFAGPSGEKLKPGAYENTTRYPFNSELGNGLDVSGDGRGCNTSTGRFDILEIEYNTNGDISSFAADFEQHCEGGEPALFGAFRFNSAVVHPAKIDITANENQTPIIVKLGDTVRLKYSVESGDLAGTPVEKYLAMLGTDGIRWYDGSRFKFGKQPIAWSVKPIDNDSGVIVLKMRSTGIFTFAITADMSIDGNLDPQLADHVVVTVQKPVVSE